MSSTNDGVPRPSDTSPAPTGPSYGSLPPPSDAGSPSYMQPNPYAPGTVFDGLADSTDWAAAGRRQQSELRRGHGAAKNALFHSSAAVSGAFKWATPLVTWAYFACLWLVCVEANKTHYDHVPAPSASAFFWAKVGIAIGLLIPTVIIEANLITIGNALDSLPPENPSNAYNRRNRGEQSVLSMRHVVFVLIVTVLFGAVSLSTSLNAFGSLGWIANLVLILLIPARLYLACGVSLYANELIPRIKANHAVIAIPAAVVLVLVVGVVGWRSILIFWAAFIVLLVVIFAQWQGTVSVPLVSTERAPTISEVLREHPLPPAMVDDSISSRDSFMPYMNVLSQLAKTPANEPLRVRVNLQSSSASVDGAAPSLRRLTGADRQELDITIEISQNPPMWSQAHWGFDVFSRDLGAPRTLSAVGGVPLIYGHAASTVTDGKFGELGDVGAKGERKTEEWLNEIAKSNGVMVLHDLVLNARGSSGPYEINVDHLVITANNLIVVDSKVWRKGTYRKLAGGVLVIDDQVQQDDHTDGKALDMAAQAMAPLARHLNLAVSKVLAVYGANVDNLETTNHVAAPWVWVRDVLAACGAVRQPVIDALIRSALIYDDHGQMHMRLD